MSQHHPMPAASRAPTSVGAIPVAGPPGGRPRLRASLRGRFWAVVGLLALLAGPGVAAGAGPAAAAVAPGAAAAPLVDVATALTSAPLLAGLPGEAPYPGRLLGRGLVGDDVRQVQAFLVGQGATLKVDGIYGPVTARAVRQFQRRSGVPADGIVGPATWARGPVTGTAPPAPPARSPAPAGPAATGPAASAAPPAPAPTTAAPVATAAPATAAPVTMAAPVTTAAPVSTAAPVTAAAPAPAPAPAAAATTAAPARPATSTEGSRMGAVWIVIGTTLALVAALIAIAVAGWRREPPAATPPARAAQRPTSAGEHRAKPSAGSKPRVRPPPTAGADATSTPRLRPR